WAVLSVAGTARSADRLAVKLASVSLDVFQEGQEHRDAGRVVVADVQHLGRAIVTSKRGGELMPVGGGVEAAGAHHRHAEQCFRCRRAERHRLLRMQVEVEPFQPSAKSAHSIYPLARRSSMLLATSSQTSAKSRSSFLTTASSAFSASCRYVAACCRSPPKRLSSLALLLIGHTSLWQCWPSAARALVRQMKSAVLVSRQCHCPVARICRWVRRSPPRQGRRSFAVMPRSCLEN